MMKLNSKLSFLFPCFFLIFSASAQVLSPEPDFSVHIEKGKMFNENGTRYLFIDIELKNNSTETLQYRSWSCSWENYYSINKMDLQIVANLCERNYATTESLEPQEVKKKTMKLKISPRFNGDLSFKIAMDFIEVIDNEPLGESGDLYWSNEITISIN